MLSISFRSVNMRLAGLTASAILCVFLPLVIGAPAGEDSLKQQIASSLLRGGNDDFQYWNALNQELYPEDPMQHSSSQFAIRTRGSLDSLGRGNILRSLDGLGNDWLDTKGSNWRLGNIGIPKRGGGLDSLGKFYEGYPSRRPGAFQMANQQKRFDSLSGATFGTQKRNFDEIDRNGFGSFVKRNFDEIDRTGLGFNKRNFDEIDHNGLGFYKKRNFDEIDRTGFGSFVKRMLVL